MISIKPAKFGITLDYTNPSVGNSSTDYVINHNMNAYLTGIDVVCLVGTSSYGGGPHQRPYPIDWSPVSGDQRGYLVVENNLNNITLRFHHMSGPTSQSQTYRALLRFE